MKSTQEERICLFCGKSFTPTCRPNGTPYRKDQKYCSKQCGQNLFARNKRGYIKDAVCSYCGVPLRTKKRVRIDKSYTYRYCSALCNKRHYYLRLREDGRYQQVLMRRKEHKLGREVGDNCKICNTPFSKVIRFQGYSARKTSIHIDHIVPKSLGGSSSPDNLREVCWFCNSVRGNSPIPDAVIKATARVFWSELNSRVENEPPVF